MNSRSTIFFLFLFFTLHLFSFLNIWISLLWTTWICVMRNGKEPCFLIERLANVSSGQLHLGFLVAAMVVFLDVLFITPGFGCVGCLYKGAGLNRECICSSEINRFFLCMSTSYRKSAFGTMYPWQCMPHVTSLSWTNQICDFSPRDRAKKCMWTPFSLTLHVSLMNK